MDEINLDIQEVKAQGAIIVAIGVGGGGSNMINHLVKTNPHKSVRLIVANTDIQALENTDENLFKIKLGEKATGGLGAGTKPDKGHNAALETYEEIKHALSGANLVFVSAGLGGGTGTGAAPVIAKAAKEVGALTVAVVTKPFKFERRDKVAEEGLRRLRAESDCIVVIPNERLTSIIPRGCSMAKSFEIVDNVLASAVLGISNVILQSGRINVDFADVETVMEHKGLALMSMGDGNGDNAASDALHKAIESPLLDNTSIKGALGILVSFETHEEYPLSEIAEAMDIIYSMADDNANVVWGMRELTDVPEHFVRVTIIATGFEKEIITSSETGKGELQSGGNVITKVEAEMLEQSKVNLQQYRRISGGDTEPESENLDVPTYLRKQKD